MEGYEGELDGRIEASDPDTSSASQLKYEWISIESLSSLSQTDRSNLTQEICINNLEVHTRPSANDGVKKYGILEVKNGHALDRETKSSIRCSIRISDGDHSITRLVRIEVRDQVWNSFFI